MKLGFKAQQYKYYQYIFDGALVPSAGIKKTKKITPGIYMILQDQQMGNFLYPKEVNFETILDLPGMPTQKIMKDLNTFWKPETKQKYLDMGLTYKRGLLLFGSPGTGKTLTVIKVCEQFIKSGGVVIFNPQASALHDILAKIRDIEPDLKVLVIWEEFDEWKDDTELLSLLDGELQTDNIVYLGTTNFIDKIPDRIKNRPSRFAERIEVKFPTLEDRKIYLQNKLKKATPKEINSLAEKTEGLVIDQIKDVVISTQVFDLSVKDALDKVKTYSLYEENDPADPTSEAYDIQDALERERYKLTNHLRSLSIKGLIRD